MGPDFSWKGPPMREIGDKASFWIAITLSFILLVVGIWDIAAGTGMVDAKTVSHIIKWWCKEWPILPFAIGVLIGHLLA